MMNGATTGVLCDGLESYSKHLYVFLCVERARTLDLILAKKSYGVSRFCDSKGT
jgi:hypothetical protein